MIIWLVGMSASGKTTIGKALYEHLKREKSATVFIDGDEVRRVFQHESASDYTLDGRLKNSWRIRELCALLDRQSIDVVCCVLSVFQEALAWNRDNLSDYFEVYLRAPMSVLEARQPADLYRRAQRGETDNVVGVDIEFPEPARPDLILDNGDPPMEVGQAVYTIMQAIADRTKGDPRSEEPS